MGKTGRERVELRVGKKKKRGSSRNRTPGPWGGKEKEGGAGGRGSKYAKKNRPDSIGVQSWIRETGPGRKKRI